MGRRPRSLGGLGHSPCRRHPSTASTRSPFRRRSLVARVSTDKGRGRVALGMLWQLTQAAHSWSRSHRGPARRRGRRRSRRARAACSASNPALRRIGASPCRTFRPSSRPSDVLVGSRTGAPRFTRQSWVPHVRYQSGTSRGPIARRAPSDNPRAETLRLAQRFRRYAGVGALTGQRITTSTRQVPWRCRLPMVLPMVGTRNEGVKPLETRRPPRFDGILGVQGGFLCVSKTEG